MKKKILSFILVLAIILPCVLMATACHSHEYTHGLCSCGDYVGITQNISNGAQITFEEIGVNETVHCRFKLEAVQHYTYLQGPALTKDNSEIKFYCRYNIGGQIEFREVVLGSDLQYFTTLPVDEYIYVDFTNKSASAVQSYPIAVYSISHSYSIEFGSSTKGVINLSEDFEGGKSYCYKYAVTAGEYMMFMSADFVEFPYIYDEDGNLLNGQLVNQGGNKLLTVEGDGYIYFHFFCNTDEDSLDSHFTIQRISK